MFENLMLLAKNFCELTSLNRLFTHTHNTGKTTRMTEILIYFPYVQHQREPDFIFFFILRALVALVHFYTFALFHFIRKTISTFFFRFIFALFC